MAVCTGVFEFRTSPLIHAYIHVYAYAYVRICMKKQGERGVLIAIVAIERDGGTEV